MKIICLPLFLAAAAFSQTVAPYSGEELAVRTRTLADGTHVAEKTVSGHLYRDSQGRTRAERSLAPDSSDTAQMVEIIDPAAGVRYTLDAQNKIARRFPLTPPVAHSKAPEITAEPALPRQQSSLEPLGKRVIEGVEVEGKRILTTILPAPDSNDRLQVVTTEMWVSRALGITLASRISDPRMGEVAYSIRNVALGEPDARLFQVPADYSIVE